MPEFEIRVGHTLDLLRATPDETYHSVVTSPPYYGLRSYEGVEPSIWGGSEFCQHDFYPLGATTPKPDRPTSGKKDANGSGIFADGQRGGQPSKEARGASISFGDYCQFCNAWRGVLGNEPTVELYVSHMVEVCREIRRVLRSDGTFWLNLGDSYAASSTSNHGRGKATPALNGHGKGQQPGGWENPPRYFAPGFKPKDLMLVPHRVAIALQADGWFIRMDVVWSKLNPLPESVEDRPTKSHEYIFLLTKTPDYFYDAEAVRERQTGTAHSRGKGVTPKSAGERDLYIRAKESFHRSTAAWHEAPDGNRNLRSVWSMASEPYREAHFATYPTKLPTICIKAGTSEVGVCPACGAPLDRLVERFKSGNDAKTATLYEPRSMGGRIRRHQQALREQGMETTPEPRTLAWVMTCDCPYSKPVPALVLDPFSGAGTTGLAALRLRRRYVGHEASEAYARMSRERIRGESPMFFTEVKKSDEDTQLQAESVGR